MAKQSKKVTVKRCRALADRIAAALEREPELTNVSAGAEVQLYLEMAVALLTKGANPARRPDSDGKNGGKVVNAVLLSFEGFQPPFQARLIAQPRFSPQSSRGPLQGNARPVPKAYDTAPARESSLPSRPAITFPEHGASTRHLGERHHRSIALEIGLLHPDVGYVF
jgi:hypothetical protein